MQKLALTWLILHRMGHAFNGAQSKFSVQFAKNIQRDIYDFMESNYLLDEDRYGEMSDNRHTRFRSKEE